MEINEDSLSHYGIIRRSGRYPWGSGENPYQRAGAFFEQREELKKLGYSEAQIAKAFGLTVADLRATVSLASGEKRAAEESQARRLREKGVSVSEIGRIMGKNESSIRSLLDPSRQAKADIARSTAAMLESEMATKRYLDIGLGVETQMGISKEKLATAVAILKEKGYIVYTIQDPQVGNPGKFTETKALVPKGTTYDEFYKSREQIELPGIFSVDGGREYHAIQPPKFVSPDRVGVRYGPEGGAERDGLIELRPGIDDISLGHARYAQVRIGVNDTHYLKGMVAYSDDLPPGVDILFNTNKPRPESGNKLDVMKPLENDPDTPMKSVVRQRYYVDENGKTQQSVLNIIGSKDGANIEGGWDLWSRRLSSQMLSKQSAQLAKQQLDLVYRAKREELAEIEALTNPAIKKKLLQSFSDGCDADSVSLHAAALPRQSNKVLIPIPSLKDTEVYAPTYNNGERVVLIRHPHGGTFEIPELRVNNKNPDGKKMLGNAPDAIGINAKVASRLSGADFDGDHVIVIPLRSARVQTSRPLKSLEGFDTVTAYPGYPGMKPLKGASMQKEMGVVSNLITDMTVKGATESELARAVKHSMVVIDSEKHGLNWKQSEIDNGIQQLRVKYQGKKMGGAATLISRSSGDAYVLDRTPRRYTDGGPIDKDTGEKVYTLTDRGYNKPITNKRTGETTEKWIPKMTKSSQMAETRDARTLSSGSAMEEVYATHANRLKALANRGRLSMISTPPLVYTPSAARAYKTEVSSLQGKLNMALRNKPLERQAQRLAHYEVQTKLKADPDLTEAQKKKIRTGALTRARARIGTTNSRIDITPKEWEAIQAGAVSNKRLEDILLYTDDTLIKQYATPRQQTSMSPAKVAMVKAMAARGYTQAEIAQQLGVSTSTINNALK